MGFFFFAVSYRSYQLQHTFHSFSSIFKMNIHLFSYLNPFADPPWSFHCVASLFLCSEPLLKQGMLENSYSMPFELMTNSGVLYRGRLGGLGGLLSMRFHTSQSACNLTLRICCFFFLVFSISYKMVGD